MTSSDSPLLPKSLKISWASGALGVALLMNGVSTLILLYMVSILKIEPALAGTLIFLSRVFDVITDPIVGVWSDRTRSAAGRRRPFLLAGAAIAPISFLLIFATPIFEQQVFTIAYVFVAMLIYTVGYTVFNVPYIAMPAEMTDNYHERSSIHGYRVAFFAIGQLLATSGAQIALQHLGKDEWSSFAWVGLGCSVVILFSMLWAFFGTKKARFSMAGAAIPDVRGELGAMLSNRHFLRLIGIKASQLLGVASIGAAMLFFIIHVMRLRLDVFAIFGVVVTASMIISTPIVVAWSKRIGKPQMYAICASLNVAYALSWILAVENEPVLNLIIRAIIVGFAVSGNVLLAMSMLTDIIAFDRNRTGVNREGVYTSLYSFIEKLTAALGPLIVGVALSLAGFDENLPSDQLQSDSVRQALLAGVAYIPAGLGILSIWLLMGYRLTEDTLRRQAGKSDNVVSESS